MEGNENREGASEEKCESPIPMKIQQVLEKFQERLSEKDDQISTLQKQIETLQNGSHYGKSIKSQPQRVAARTVRDSAVSSSGASGYTGERPRRVFRPPGRPPPSASTYANKGKSRSVPSSPSKKISIPPKASVSRPHSRQALGSEQSSSFGLKHTGSKSFIEKNKQRFRSANGIKQAEKTAETKPAANKFLKNEKQKANMSKAIPIHNGKESSGLQQMKNGNAQSGKSVDSGSSYSADSRASSAADFVSVSGSPSPGLSIDGSNHTDNSCPPFIEEDVLTYNELTTRLKRLTDEHGKLQAEHSRVLAMLVDRRHEEKYSRIMDCMDLTEQSTTESSALISDRNHLEMIESSSENTLASTDSDQLFSEQKLQSEATIKEFCKQEVLRLREEVLALHKHKAELEKKLDDSHMEVKELLKDKEHLQQRETETTSQVESLLEKIDTLERECQTKEFKILELEKEIDILQKQCHLQQHQLDLKDEHIIEFKRQLQEKSLLLQEMEKEANEMKEFMQAERSTLSEALAEAEAEIEDHKLKLTHLQVQLEVKSQNLQGLQNNEESHSSCAGCNSTTNQNTEWLEVLHLKGELESMTKFSQGMLIQDIQLVRITEAISQFIHQLKDIIDYVAYHIDPLVANKIMNEFNEDATDTGSSHPEFIPKTNNVKQDENVNNNVPYHSSFVQEVISAFASQENNHVDTFLTLDASNQPDHTDEKLYTEFPFVESFDYNGLKLNSDEIVDNFHNNNTENSNKTLERTKNANICEHLLQQVRQAKKLVACMGRLFKVLVEDHQRRCTLAEERSERIQQELRKQRCLSDDQIKSMQEEMELLHSKEKLIHQDLKKAINKQNETQRALQQSENEYKQLANEFENITDQQYEIDLMKEQIQDLQKAKKKLEIEKKLIAEQLDEAMKKICELSPTNPASGDSFSFAEFLNEKYQLKNEIQKLAVQVLEKEKEIAKYKTKCLKYKELFCSNSKVADEETKQMDTVFNHVLETLRTIPDIVGSCEPLHKLWLELEDDESRAKT